MRSHTTREPAQSRRLGQRGAALVESAFVLFPMVLLTAGIFDVAVAIMVKATFTHAAREGARYAITYQVSPGLGQDASIKKVVKTNAMGLLTDSNITINYYDGNNPSTLIAPPGGNAPNNIVVVSIDQFNWRWMVPVVMGGRSPFNIKASSADRMEGLGAGQTAPAR
jgi:Flp pilus assembly protein TadG